MFAKTMVEATNPSTMIKMPHMKQPSAVAPFPLPGVDRVFVDRNLLSHKQVWIGAGSPRHMAVIAPGDLVRLARAQAMDVVEPAT